MKVLKTLTLGWLLLVLVGAALAVANPGPVEGQTAPRGYQVVSDSGRLAMLEDDQRMLQDMRATLRPNMSTMIDTNPMWVDPEMVRLQEDYQAQLDRMLAVAPSRP